MSRNGFTLVEMLVALTVSAFLLAALSWIVSRLGSDVGSRQDDDPLRELVALRPALTALIESARVDKDDPVMVTRSTLQLVTAPPTAMGPVGPVTLSLVVRGKGGARWLDGSLAPVDGGVSRTFSTARAWDDVTIATLPAASEDAPATIEIMFRKGKLETAVVAKPMATTSGRCIFDPISMACR